MNNFLSRITSLGKNGWENLGFAKKAENVLSDGFDISTATEISESDLIKIFAYRITPDTLPFFIISNQGANIPKRKFKVDDTKICYESDWFGLIQPNDSLHIVIPSENKWVSFNIRKQSITRPVIGGEVWGLGGGIFQLDKNLEKEIIHTQVNIEALQKILTQTFS